MQCANSPLLHFLIQSYPKALYSFRAFTHALAYFNSCLNPYLYALLNRSFCIDLVDIIPLWSICCKRTPTLEHENSCLHTKYPAITTTAPDAHLLTAEKYLNDDRCQVELLETQQTEFSS